MILARPGNKPGVGEFRGVKCEVADARRVEPRAAARPVQPAGAFCGDRCRGRRAGAARGALSRTRRGAALAAPACAWRSTCRSRPLPASPCGCDRRGREPPLSVILEHNDPSLALPLFPRARPTRPSPNGALGARCSGLPLLVAEATATARAECPHGRRAYRAPAAAPPPPQRVQEPPAVDSAAPRIRARLTGATPVHRGEREIIARN